ncbi:hypothetical protein HaLaN_32236, partial [Haematococcus lacustris]
PGLIDRGDKKREIEKVVATVLSSTACDKLAALMVKHAMRLCGHTMDLVSRSNQ